MVVSGDGIHCARKGGTFSSEIIKGVEFALLSLKMLAPEAEREIAWGTFVLQSSSEYLQRVLVILYI